MIKSLTKIEFITAQGTRLLLDYGDFVAQEPAPKVNQKTSQYAAAAAPWGEGQADGGASTALNWSVRRDHDSHAALRSFIWRHAAEFPSYLTGTIRVSVQGGDSWDIHDACLITSEPTPLVPSSGFRSLTTYTAIGFTMLPAAALTLTAGIRWEFILQNWEDVNVNWENL